MGRKKKKDLPLRSRIIEVRVTPELHEAIKMDALAAGRSVSDYVRMLLTGKTPRVYYEVVFNDPRTLRSKQSKIADTYSSFFQWGI